MLIKHEINELLFELFPRTKNFGNNLDILKEEITNYYTYDIHKPEVEIHGNLILVSIEVNMISSENKIFTKVVNLCEKGKYVIAKPILEKLIKNNPSMSEYHRVLGQIYSIEGNQEKAINHLINALKWDPKNKYACIMMGNIFAEFKGDAKTAMTYFNKALEIDPNEFIVLNNIGANFLKLNKYEDAERYYNLALDLNPDNPYTLLGLAQLNIFKNNLITSFDFCVQALKNLKLSEPIYKEIFEIMKNISYDYLQGNSEKNIFEKYKLELMEKSGKTIEIIFDENIISVAKIELAELYHRENHLIKYREKRISLEHLLMHELVHLNFNLEARKVNSNKRSISFPIHKENFLGDIEGFIQKAKKNGILTDNINEEIHHWFETLTGQMFNTPIDLYVEDFLYEHFPEIRPIQFLSLMETYQNAIKVLNLPERAESFPHFLSDINTILILVLIYQFKDLFGIDFLPICKVSNYQKRISKNLYNEWLRCRYSRTAGSEYIMVEEWSKILKLTDYFELIDENLLSNLINDSSLI